MRWMEFVLWAVPIAAAGLWWFGPRHFSRRAVAGALLLLALYMSLLWHLAGQRRIDGHYRPAHIENGRIVPSAGN
jgi:hypothetical protein